MSLTLVILTDQMPRESGNDTRIVRAVVCAVADFVITTLNPYVQGDIEQLGPELMPFMLLRANFLQTYLEYWKERRALERMETYVQEHQCTGPGLVEEMLQYTKNLEKKLVEAVDADPSYWKKSNYGRS